MKNLKDAKTKIYPSTTRTRKELPSSSALDSPSVMSNFVTPTPAIDSNVSHVIDDAILLCMMLMMKLLLCLIILCH